jgi:hypothetical protein
MQTKKVFFYINFSKNNKLKSKRFLISRKNLPNSITKNKFKKKLKKKVQIPMEVKIVRIVMKSKMKKREINLKKKSWMHKKKEPRLSNQNNLNKNISKEIKRN